MILAGDVGGTNARLAVLEQNGAQFNIIAEHDYPSRDFNSLEDIVAEFVKERQCIVEHACIAVAGPVLKLAPRLAESDLIDVARTKGQAHLHAISGTIVGADVVEYNPAQDISDLTATVAAKIVKEILGQMIAARKE